VGNPGCAVGSTSTVISDILRRTRGVRRRAHATRAARERERFTWILKLSSDLGRLARERLDVVRPWMILNRIYATTGVDAW